MDLSIVIVNYNTADLINKCIESLGKYTKNILYEVIVVDNNSHDESVNVVHKLSKKYPVHLIVNKNNTGFAAANNKGAKKASGRYILFLNSDTELYDNVLGELTNWMDKHGDVGIVSPLLKNKDGSIQGTGGYFPTLLSVFSWMTIQDFPFVDKFIKPFHPMRAKSIVTGSKFYLDEKELDWVTGAFIFMRKEVFDYIEGWDENYFMYTEDVDLCFRVKNAGWKVYYLPKWSIVHYGGASSTKEFAILSEFKGLKRFYKKNYPLWKFNFLRLFLKIGALGRIVLFRIIEGKESAKIYAKAFKIA